MPSFTTAAWMAIIVAGGVRGAVMQAPKPVTTPGPTLRMDSGMDAFVRRQDPDAISFAQILLTAIPESLREIAATNLPAVSSILWDEFLDDNKPNWFKDLPTDLQNYLIRKFGPSTAWPTATPTGSLSNSDSAATTPASSGQSSAASSGTTAPTNSVTASVPVSTGSADKSTAIPTESSSSDSSPSAASNSSDGLTRNQKIGIGLGVPLALLGAAALLLGCCFLLRRRHKSINGSQPPSSPGFIPRFAFQEKGEHHTPLNGQSREKHISQDSSYSNYSNWDDDVIEPMENTQMAGGNGKNNNHVAAEPIPVPTLYHTHSSNRARGKRTSYSSLRSVPEVNEPDESPVLPREQFRPAPPRRLSAGLVPGATQTKRKPIPSTVSNTSPRSSGNANGLAAAAAAATASHGLLRPSPPFQNNSNSSSDSSTSNISRGSGLGNSTHVTASPVSPITDASPLSKSPFSNDPTPPLKNPKRYSQELENPFSSSPPTAKNVNPFSNDYYIEDYGPEYIPNVYPYDDLENGLYGGHTDLSRYPEYDTVEGKGRRKSGGSSKSRRGSAEGNGRTEWPLRNVMGGGHRRNKSPLWDRVYEG